ncbi:MULTISPECIES: TrfB-related DNA-binding protein [Gammaproteobacteria]|uniref:TrfB-related DNA-binding protein n=1 Tax=Gammaproteobacteria TaxID=1236 RepID=UPI00130FDC60|nr:MULTISPECIES: TrfB-related DNA-binding protein [Gammaproteobacteria]
MTKKRLTPAQFQQAVDGLSVGEQTLAIAHGVLVEGLPQSHFASTLGLSKGAVSQAVHRVWSAVEDDMRLTDAQFKAATTGLNVRPQTLEIAHGVLVQGIPQAHYVATLGLSKGAVSQAVHRVWSAVQGGLPEGYERVEAVLPLHQAQKVREWDAATRQEIDRLRNT